MIELILGFMMCAALGKIASADDQSGILWGLCAFVILLALLWQF